jgi:hypothetical protein
LSTGDLGLIYPESTKGDSVMGSLIMVIVQVTFDKPVVLFTLGKRRVNLGRGTAHLESAARDVDHYHIINGADLGIAQSWMHRNQQYHSQVKETY